MPKENQRIEGAFAILDILFETYRHYPLDKQKKMAYDAFRNLLKGRPEYADEIIKKYDSTMRKIYCTSKT